ncbi:1609_t:CDS:2 [Funneliformis mosseae]|uniref:1609_t:CDS:1 n=1 Tax=Funneliformis mosseae TaxID=27381 RepID=A0A9N9HAG4_FUNMO|nr:1609_t:CDS:2 [Funneliformis mosseae]
MVVGDDANKLHTNTPQFMASPQQVRNLSHYQYETSMVVGDGTGLSSTSTKPFPLPVRNQQEPSSQYQTTQNNTC